MWINKQIDLNPDEDFNEVKQYIPDLYIEKVNNPEGSKMKSTTFFMNFLILVCQDTPLNTRFNNS